MTAVLITVEGLSKSYRRGPERVDALREAAFALSTGEFVALIGPSGSGKTTLLNLLAGWEDPDAGRVLWRGSEPKAPLADLPWDEVAVVPQRLGLLEELSVAENVALPLRLRGGAVDDPRAVTLLERFGLVHLAHHPPNETSLGEQQRTAVARALILQPRLLLADEPTGHQDETWSHGVFQLLRTACDTGTTCLVATHNREVVPHAGRVVRLHDGAVVADGG